MNGGQRIAAFLILAVLFLVGSGILATLKMLRSSDMPLWTQTDLATGRKTHGYLNWWLTLFLIGVLVDGVLFGALPTLLDAWHMLSGMLTGPKAAG